ncbi:MAG TPA: hypothetical protein VHV83_03760 [Armatimonadota bacterium]|nr:hypothetical protein [Armatimonadota bacterium]
MISPIRPDTKVPPNVELRLDRVRFRGIANGKVVWEVIADHFDLSKDQMTFKVTGVKKVALLNGGKQELTISADSLDRNTITGDISITGSVTVTGNDIFLRASQFNWSDRLQTLNIPLRLSAQLGDITVISDKGAVYNVMTSTLRSSGKIVLGFKGNLLRANGVTLDGRNQSFTMNGPITAEIVVADAQQWVEGKGLPEIPDIPEQVKDRYQQYTKYPLIYRRI